MLHRSITVAARVLGGVAVTGALTAGTLLAATPAHAATAIPDVLAKIRYCESGNNYAAQNPTSSASGAYQFLTSTWQSLSASAGYATAASAPAAVQDAAALELYAKAGTAPWAASQSCWSALGAVPTTVTNTSGSGSASTTSTTAQATAAPARQAQAPAQQQAGQAQQGGQAQSGQAQGGQPKAQPQGARPAPSSASTDRDGDRDRPVAGAPHNCR